MPRLIDPVDRSAPEAGQARLLRAPADRPGRWVGEGGHPVAVRDRSRPRLNTFRGCARRSGHQAAIRDRSPVSRARVAAAAELGRERPPRGHTDAAQRRRSAGRLSPGEHGPAATRRTPEAGGPGRRRSPRLRPASPPGIRRSGPRSRRHRLARPISMSYGVSPSITTSAASSPEARSAASTMSGAGLDASASSELVSSSIRSATPAFSSSTVSSSSFAELATTRRNPTSRSRSRSSRAPGAGLQPRGVALQEDLAASLRDPRADALLVRQAWHQLRQHAIAAHPDERTDAVRADLVAGFAERIRPRLRMGVDAQHERAVDVQQHSLQGHDVLLRSGGAGDAFPIGCPA